MPSTAQKNTKVYEFHLLADATVEELKYQKFSVPLVADKYIYTILVTSFMATEQYVSKVL